jgi:hypothetical protein
MNRSKFCLVLPRAAWLLAAGTLALGFTCSRSSTATISTPTKTGVETSAPPATATVWPGLYANTIDDAIRLTASLFTGHGGTLSVARPESVSYVATTAAQARAMIPDGVLQVPDETPVWLIVAHGEFLPSSVGVSVTPIGPPSTTAWIVIVQGAAADFMDGYNNDRYDLSQLGTVVDLAPSEWAAY